MKINKLLVLLICLLAFSTQIIFASTDKTKKPSSCLSLTKFHTTYGEGISDSEVDLINGKHICFEESVQKPTNPDASFGLARVYQIEGLFEKAFKSYLQAYENGSADAAVKIANLYFRKQIPSSSPYQDAFKWAQKAADAGSAEGLWWLGSAYAEGIYVNSNFTTASEYFKKASELGHSYANIELGDLHYFGYGVEEDNEIAKDYYYIEYARGNPDGIIKLANLKLYNPNDQVDVLNSIKIISEFALNYPEGEAVYHFIYMNLSPSAVKHIKEYYPEFRPDVKTSLDLISDFLNLDSRKIVENIFQISSLVINDDILSSLSKNEQTKIINHFKKLIFETENIQEKLKAQLAHTVAITYSYGLIGPKNDEEASIFYEIASDLGKATSALNLGWTYFENPKMFNMDKAIKHTVRASLSEDPYIAATAFNNLGVFYQDQKDFDESAENYIKSVEIIKDSDFYLEWPAENLVRLYITGRTSEGISPEKALEYAEYAANEGVDFFKKFLARYNLKKDTSIEEIKDWMIDTALRGDPSAFVELGWIAEDFDSKIEAVKWFSLCSFLCEIEGPIAVSDAELETLRKDMVKSAFDQGRTKARAWRKDIWEETLVAKKIPKKITNKSTSLSSLKGHNYAFLIGVSDYAHLTPLKTPLRDVQRISSILEKKYQYKVNVLENPTREEILSQLNSYKNILEERDNLLVYFAGHGVLEEDEGFWLPKNAKQDDDTNWLSNTTVKRKMKNFSSKNILVLADSCFSGSLTRGLSIVDVVTEKENKDGKNIFDLYLDTKSRVVISSGGEEPVNDGGGSGYSVFARALIDSLQKYNEPFTSAFLYNDLRDQVLKNSVSLGIRQTPYYGEILDAGHKGPDFVFVPVN